MDSDQAKKALIHAFQSHRIAVSDDDLQTAFDTTELLPEIVGQCLQTETFLSREEAELFSRLQKDGTARHIMESYDFCLVRPLPDAEIEDALRKLRSSTTEIEQLTSVLKAQQDALAKIQEENRLAQLKYRRTVESRQRKRLQELRDTSLAVQGLLRTVSLALSTTFREVANLHDSSPSIVADFLKQDDKMLARMNEMLSKVPDLDYEKEMEETKLQTLRAKLIAFVSDEIRCRLDRTYLEALDSSRASNEPWPGADSPDEGSLKTELGTLYSEIGDVAQMTIDQEFTVPLIKMIRSKSKLKNGHVELLLDNADANIKHLREKIHQLVLRLRHHGSHLEALKILRAELRKLSLATNQDTSMSPPKRGNHMAHSPYKTANKDSTEHSMAIQARENVVEPSHRRLLRNLGCPPLHDSNQHTIQDKLDSLASDRSEKVKEGSKNLDAAIDLLLASHVEDASCTTRLIVGGLLEDTAYQSVHLLDERLRLRISTLETEASKIGSRMEELELDELSMPCKEREAFVSRWDT